MGYRAIEPVQITGISSAANTNFAFGWTTGIDIANFVSIPAPATAVVFSVVNDSSSSESIGIRHNNNTSNVYAVTSFAGGRFNNYIATLEGPANTVFDFHTTSAAAVKFFVSGFFHDIVVFTPENRISKSTSTNQWIAVTVSEVPDGTTYVLQFNTRLDGVTQNKWREVGGNVSYPSHGYSFIKLDQNKQFELNTDSSGAATIHGYTNKNFIQLVSNVATNSISNTTYVAGSWQDYPTSFPGKEAILIHTGDDGVSAWNTSASVFFRTKGSTWNIARNGLSNPNMYIVKPDANGQFEYWIENAFPRGNLIVSGFLTENVPDHTLTQISNSNAVVAGQVGVEFYGKGLSNVDAIRITANTRTINVNVSSANNTTAVANVPSDSDLFQSDIYFGNVSFSLEISGNAVANLSGNLYFSQDIIGHDVTNVSSNGNPNCIYYAQAPSVKVGDKLAIDSKTKTNEWQVSVDDQGFLTIDVAGDRVSDNLDYRIYHNEFQKWSNANTVFLNTPYKNANNRTTRILPSGDGKRYSKYPDGLN